MLSLRVERRRKSQSYHKEFYVQKGRGKTNFVLKPITRVFQSYWVNASIYNSVVL